MSGEGSELFDTDRMNDNIDGFNTRLIEEKKIPFGTYMSVSSDYYQNIDEYLNSLDLILFEIDQT
jgi:hypothetical protein